MNCLVLQFFSNIYILDQGHHTMKKSAQLYRSFLKIKKKIIEMDNWIDTCIYYKQQHKKKEFSTMWSCSIND